MSGVTLQGIKVPNITIRRNKEDGSLKMTGAYELISSNGRVLAKQEFNGYNELEVPSSKETMELINKLIQSVEADLHSVLGL